MATFKPHSIGNEVLSSIDSMLAAGYPLLYHLLRHTQMPALDFFAWDTGTVKRDLLHRN